MAHINCLNFFHWLITDEKQSFILTAARLRHYAYFLNVFILWFIKIELLLLSSS